MKTSPLMAPSNAVNLEALRREVEALRRENDLLKNNSQEY